MSDLAGITQTPNLTVETRDALELLLQVRARTLPRNTRLNAYYEGESPVASIGIDNIPDSIRPGVACDWAAKAVNSVAERVRLDTFTLTDSMDSSGLLAGVPTAFNRVTASLLTHGCGFVTVNQTHTGTPKARFHSAENAAAIWDYDQNQLAAGLVIADKAFTKYSPTRPIPTQVNIYLPGNTIIFTRSPHQSTTWAATTAVTNLPAPMMMAITYRPTGNKPLGQSRITPTVRYLVDEVKRTLLYMAISGAVYATPMMTLLGVDRDTYEALTSKGSTSFLMKAGEWLIASANENGDTPDVKMLAGQNPTPYIQALEGYAKLFSGATGVPLNSLGVVQDNPSSAEAIEVSREDIITAAEDLIETATPVLRDTARLMLAVQNNQYPWEVQDVPEPVFRNPSRPSLAATADAMVKIAGVLPGFAGTQEFLQGMGFTGVEVDRIRTQVRQSAARETLLQALAGQTTSTPANIQVDETTVDEPEQETGDTSGDS